MRSGYKVASIGVRAIAAKVRIHPLYRLSTASLSTSAPLRTTGDHPTNCRPPRGPIGVARALQAFPTACTSVLPQCHAFHFSDNDARATETAPAPTLFAHEFSLADRVALVSGANRGIGLEMALAFVEAGARAVYCVDLPKAPCEEWAKVGEYAKALRRWTRGDGRLEYVSADVRDQVRARDGRPDSRA